MQWYDWIAEKKKRGEKQKQCKYCGHWFFPEEM
jgi:uncharacterized OB-fold protein